MYDQLYEAWKQEVEDAELKNLPSDFYSKITDYLRQLKEESRMLDKRTVKARLLKREMQNVKRMAEELIHARYRKLVKKACEDEKTPSGSLTIEEKKIYTSILQLSETYQNFAKNVLRGHAANVDIEQNPRKEILRFLKDVPAIIGADMETYGPFKTEDVASLPIENSRILTRQGLAKKIEV